MTRHVSAQVLVGAEGVTKRAVWWIGPTTRLEVDTRVRTITVGPSTYPLGRGEIVVSVLCGSVDL